jgi:MscS family membrane protein
MIHRAWGRGRIAGLVVLCVAMVLGSARPGPSQPAGRATASAPAKPSATAPQPATPVPLQAPPPVVQAPDPYRRETPRGAMLGFIQAAQANNFAAASQYLQWPRLGLEMSREDAARELKFVLNRGFNGNLDRLSRDAMGTLSDGLSPERELAGQVVLSDGDTVDVFLARVTQRDAGSIWLVAADTVAEIRHMHDRVGLPELERRLPTYLTESQFGSLPLWVPLGILILIPALYVMSRLAMEVVARAARGIARLRKRPASPVFGAAWVTWSRPGAFLLTLFLHRSLAPAFGVPLLYRLYYDRFINSLLVAGIVWLLWRITDAAFERVRARLAAMGNSVPPAAFVPGRKLVKGTILALGALTVLAIAGVNLSATIAGLGITSLVIAFAAQRTLENVFGGFSVLADRTIVVGDFCRIGTYLGEVEEVGLRSTRLRTLDRTILHVPNGALATMQLENLSRRDRFLFKHLVAVRYETPAAELHTLMQGMRQLLENDTRVDPATSHVRLLRFAPFSFEVEVYAQVLVTDYEDFLAIQEELLLAITGILESAGTGFAVPSQIAYLRSDPSTPTPSEPSR